MMSLNVIRKRTGFTLVEVLVTIAVAAVLACIVFFTYTRVFNKAVTTEALVNVHKIREAEKMRKAETGSYVAAKDTEEINKLLELNIRPKYYEYRVEDVSDDDFIVIARRIGDDIEENGSAANARVIVMNGAGEIRGGGTTPGVRRSGGGTTGTGGTTGDSGSTPVTTGTTSGTSGIGTGRSSGGGGSGGGSSGGGSGGGSGGTEDDGGETVSLASVMAVLENSTEGKYYYDLIFAESVSYGYEDMSGALGLFYPPYYGHFDTGYSGLTNHIALGTNIGSAWTAEAIACVLIHEAMHADYAHNTEKWVADTVSMLGVPREELNWTTDPVTGEEVLLDSVDQEYQAFKVAVLLWNEVKGTQTNEELDDLADKYAQGEAVLYNEVASRYVGYEEYYKERR